MRILHFSDFHLNGKKIEDAMHTLKYMIKSLKKINEEQSIDLVIFSGDMLERGGAGYNGDLRVGFNDFKEKVIVPIMTILNLPLSRFIFTPGNHDIDREADDEIIEAGIEEKTKEFNDIVKFAKDQKIHKYTARINDFKDFEKEYYEEREDLIYRGSRFVSTFEYDINGTSVGISSLNNVWRCGFDDRNKIALGIHQIAENTEHLNEKSLRIAVMHYPIEFLKETERHIVMELCARNFDILFCGHSHHGYVNMQVPLINNAFLEVNTAGTLSANTYINDSRYKNGFQIVDCESNVRYSVRKYYQVNFQDFVLDINEEYPDGNNIRHYPNPTQIAALYNAYIKEMHKAEELRINHAISPFVLFNEFIKRPNNVVMKSEFIKSDRIGEIMEEIRSSSMDYRLMALSGMGKTRIIAETFRDIPNVYYSHTGNCVNAVHELLKLKNPDVIVVDNCCNMALREIQKRIDESGKKVRLISIHNVLTPNELSTRGQLRTIDYNDTQEVVEHMLAKEICIRDNECIITRIRERSGNIPYMTLLLLDAYRKKNTLSIDNADEILSTILSGSEPLERNTSNALKALSLFEPLGYESGIKEEYEFVINNNKIHHIALNQDAVNRVFIDMINDYLKRQLLEKDGSCIRIRPRPLAEWLTETWLIEYGSDMPDIIDEIAQLEENLSKRLFRALNKRFKEMGTSSNAQNVINIINNPENGSFHNERIAFSKTGSQLFLSMGLVSPVMVAKNLFSLIDYKSIEWLRDVMNLDARRNLVWALENICMNSEAFIDGARCLARLAVAESEEISNNATGQFLQLFHIFLSGTQANLNKRIELIQILRKDEIYLPLLIKAIGHAFISRDFHRVSTSDSPMYSNTPNDFSPTATDIISYWRGCVDILINITEEKTELLPDVIKMLPERVGNFAHMREMPLLYRLIEHYGKHIDYQWPEMRDSLSMCLRYWFKGPEIQRKELVYWLEKMEPRTLHGKIKACLKDNYFQIKGDPQEYGQKMINLMSPYAVEFINNKLYKTHELENIIFDNQLNTHWFAWCVSKEMDKYGLTQDVLNSILNVVLNQTESYESDFILLIINWTTDLKAVNEFKSNLYVNKRYCLYASIIGILDNEKHLFLQELLDGYKNAVFDNLCINKYLRQYKHHTIKNILDIFYILNEAQVSAKDVCYPYMLNHLLYHITSCNNDELKRYQKFLLEFNFNDSNPHLSSLVVKAMCSILAYSNDADFAGHVHKKVVEHICEPMADAHPFEQLYFDLLPKFQDSILYDLCEILSSKDEKIMFYYRMYNYLGSGFNTSAGPLFQCNEEILKEACHKHSTVLPQRFAQMCPVYKYSENGEVLSFSDFFLWLCDNFGEQKEMLQAFSSNMGTYSWFGVSGLSDYIAERIPCLTNLLSHSSLQVREWAKLELELVKKEVMHEKGIEAYERMIRG